MITRLFLDTNIVLDLLAERRPFYEPAAKIASMADRNEVELFISALTFSTAYYLLARHENAASARKKLSKFKILCKILPVNETISEKAMNSGFKDFEDGIQYFCALDGETHVLITRNAKDFKLAELPLMTADEYIKSIGKR